MTPFRFLMLLSLAIWLGALVFFPTVAQTAFATLPPHLAGLVIRGSLLKLHWMAFSCGLIFLASSLAYNRLSLGRTRAPSASHILIFIMWRSPLSPNFESFRAWTHFEFQPAKSLLSPQTIPCARSLTPSMPGPRDLRRRYWCSDC